MFPVSPALSGVFFTSESPGKFGRNYSRADIVNWLYHCRIASNSKIASYIVDAHLILMKKVDSSGAEKG